MEELLGGYPIQDGKVVGRDIIEEIPEKQEKQNGKRKLETNSEPNE